jgi:hypothetical protein
MLRLKVPRERPISFARPRISGGLARGATTDDPELFDVLIVEAAE